MLCTFTSHVIKCGELTKIIKWKKNKLKTAKIMAKTPKKLMIYNKADAIRKKTFEKQTKRISENLLKKIWL